MRLKTTLILLGVAVILILFIQLYEKKKPSTEEWELQQAKVFTEFKPERVSQIEIKKEDGTFLIKKLEEGRWVLEKPRPARADATEVKSILSELEFLSKIGTISPEGGKPVDLASYGLDKPQIETSYWTGPTQSDKYTFYVGARRAGGTEVYMRHEGGKEVYMVKGTLMDKLAKSLNDLRSKDIFEIDPNAVQRLELRYATGEGIRCFKEGENWRLESPVTDKGDNEKIMGVIHNLRGLTLKKEDFITDEAVDLDKFGLANPQLTAIIQEKGKTQTLLLGNTRDNKIYAKRLEESALFFLKDNTISLLKRHPNELRDKKLARFDPLYVSKVELKTRDQNIIIEKTKEYDYLITQPVNVLADRDTFKGFLETIKELEIQNFVADKTGNLAPYGLDQPEADITITLKDDPTKPIRLQIGRKDERGALCYIKRTGEEPVFSVKAEKLYDPATRGYLAFRDRLVLEFNRDKAQKLVMERDNKRFLLEKEQGQKENWLLKEPLEVEADEELTNNIIWSLSFLKADRYVEEGPKDLKPYGLDTPTIKVTITYAQGLPMEGKTEGGKATPTEGEIFVAEKEPKLESKTLFVGKKVKEGENANSYATLQGGNLVFEMSWTEVRYLESEPASKMLVKLEYPEVTGVSLTYFGGGTATPDKEVIYQKKGEAWEMIKPEQKSIATREIESILYHLKNLKADSIAQYSAKDLTQYGLDKPLFKLTLNTDKGEKSITMGNQAEKGMHYVKASDSDFVFLVSHEKLEKLMKEKPVREASKAPVGG
ncbi:MAG TPA: DUF4340 domain-containing protein [Candidatus Hypogeohydataceae bacterium YC40]